MTPDDWFAVIVASAIIMIIIAFWLYGRVMYKDGWNDRGDHERSRRSARELEAARQPALPATYQWMAYQPGRHAPWQPRVTVTRDTIAFAGGPATVPISHRTDSGELRALAASTDGYITRMQADEETWRRQLVTR